MLNSYYLLIKPKLKIQLIMSILIMLTKCQCIAKKREVTYRILSNYLVYMRCPLQTNQTLQEIGACWHTKNAFLDFSSANFLQSQQILTNEITTHLTMRISTIYGDSQILQFLSDKQKW